jgi:hypothetical protein
MRYKFIIDNLKKNNPSALFADGFDSAIIGYTQNKGPNVAVYDAEKCISILIESGMTTEEATNHFEEQVIKVYSSANDPIFVSL